VRNRGDVDSSGDQVRADQAGEDVREKRGRVDERPTEPTRERNRESVAEPRIKQDKAKRGQKRRDNSWPYTSIAPSLNSLNTFALSPPLPAPSSLL
jgi:hypothetical protein